MQRPRYRVFTEKNGLALFDRCRGTLHTFGGPCSVRIREFLVGAYRTTPAPSELGSLSDLVLAGELNVEPGSDVGHPLSDVYAPAPRRIYWELTRSCNLACGSCYNRSLAAAPELSFDEIILLGQQFYEAGVCELRLTGGEPTRRPDFARVAHELSEMGFYLSMGTNGVYSPELLQTVLDAPIDWVIVSVDGSEREQHEKLRGPGTFDRTMHTLRRFSEQGGRLRVNTLIRNGHFHHRDLVGLASLCCHLGVESLNCIPLRPFSQSPSVGRRQLGPLEFLEFVVGVHRLRREFPELHIVTALDLQPTSSNDRVFRKHRACAAGREGAVVSPWGEIYACSYSLASDPLAPPRERAPYVAGDLRQEQLLDVWNNASRWTVFRDEESFKHPSCRSCRFFQRDLCIGNCPIMNPHDPGAPDPYCYVRVLESASSRLTDSQVPWRGSDLFHWLECLPTLADEDLDAAIGDLQKLVGRPRQAE